MSVADAYAKGGNIGSHRQLELWGGIECTHNRVGDVYFDQIQWSGHENRSGDLEQIASLGIRTLRYPALWEWAVPDEAHKFDWSWADDRLPAFQALGLRPIVGLLHHGSGPRYTNLLDAELPRHLASYAGALAERFPWLSEFTPVNEPLTTARFSTLYGVWHPHVRSDLAFGQAMLNQCRATVLAMRQIRRVNSAAQLIQTEDLGTVFSKPMLQYQADFENERRWLTFDLLCGKVDAHHPLGDYFIWLGIPRDDLLWFADNPSPPDIVGVNYYVTSERYLDEQIEKYPPQYHGGNGRHVYADVEAVRARPDGLAGVGSMLQQAWDRYRLPLAITEAHLGCRREQQMRWLSEIWLEAKRAASQGIDVRAVTAWSLLGAFDWDSLVTRPSGHYESGAFDLRGGKLHPTGVATIAAQLAAGQAPRHPVLEQPGWWRRDDRLFCNPAGKTSSVAGRPLLITGGAGTLATAFARACAVRSLPCRVVNRAQLDIADTLAARRAIDEFNPWAVINAAGFVNVDAAESEQERCWRENVLGPTVLASACREHRLPLVTFSSDLVFDGRQNVPYCEQDPVNPLGAYGRSKAAADGRVLALSETALIIRTSAFFGPWDVHNFVIATLRNLQQGGRSCALDATVSPTYVPDLVQGSLDLLIDGASGIWHLSSEGQATWGEFAQAAAQRAGFSPDAIEVCTAADLKLPATRPSFSALTTHRGLTLPHWQDGLERFFRDRCLDQQAA